jgi:signal transduction histidine kinase
MTRAIAWLLALASALCVIGDTLIVSAYGSLWSTDTLGLHGWPFVDLAGLGCSVLGAVIVMTYPRHLIGWLLTIVGVTTSVSLLVESYSRWVVDHGGPGSTAAGEISASIALALGGPFALSVLGVIFLTVPDGELVSRRWRPVAWAACLGYVLSLAGLLITPPSEIVSKADATAGMSPGEVLSSIGILLTAVALVVGVVSMVIRLRRSQGERRQQLRWVVTAAIFVAVALTAILLDQSLSDDGNQSPVTSIPLYLSYVALIASIAISVLRFRLYDLDIIISRAVALACATAFVTGAYVVAVVAVGDRLDGDAESFGLSLAITAIVSLAFQPLRRWVVRLADRLAYGRRAQPYDALAEFSRRAGDSPAPDELLPAVAEAAGLAVSALESTARLDLPDGTHRSATWTPRTAGRQSPGDWVELPVADQSGPVGAIRFLLPATRNLRRHEERLMRDIAEQAAVAFRNVRLEAALAAHVEQLDQQTAELAASRARLIRASDSERHRLELAISDQVLSRLRELRAGLAALPDGGPTAEQAAGFVTDATTALESLRDLTKGLHPTLLTRSGLASALSSYVGRADGATSLVVEPAVSAARWPDRVEAAAYFCCTHAIMYGGVGTMTVRVAPDADALEIELAGAALDPPARQSMVDRVEALRGSIEDIGDRITIRLPRETEPSAVPVS